MHHFYNIDDGTCSFLPGVPKKSDIEYPIGPKEYQMSNISVLMISD